MITFSNIVRDVRATENNNNVQNCNIEFKPDKKATKSESVGLDINLVTSPIEENKNFETSEKVNLTESVTFSGLVRQDNKSSEKKFGIQASSDDDSMLPDYMDSNNMIENAIKAATTVQPVNVSYNKSVRKNNWFTRICDQKGEDYITSGKIRVDEINADKILDEMINGRIDYSKQGHLVMTPIIIETLIGYCSNKLSISKALQFSLCICIMILIIQKKLRILILTDLTLLLGLMMECAEISRILFLSLIKILVYMKLFIISSHTLTI